MPTRFAPRRPLMLMNAHSSLVPPLREARVNDWIRHHLMVSAGMHTVTPEQLSEAVSAKRDPNFDALRNARLAQDCGGHWSLRSQEGGAQ